MLSFANKVAGAISIILTYSALAAVGYRPAEGAVNTLQAIHGLEAIFLIGPIFFVMLGGTCFIGWRLDATRHGDIRLRLDARDAEIEAAMAATGASTEAVVIFAETSKPG